MRNKKAISDLIGWVLLIGFTITIAAFVTTWVIDQTKKFNPEDVAGGLKIYCDDVMLSIDEIKTYEGSETISCENGVGKKLILTLKNKGKFTILGLKGFGVKNLNYNFPDGKLDPGINSDVNFYFCKLTDGNTEIEIIPEIEVEDKKGYCSDNGLIINDSILDNIETNPV